MQGNKYKLRDTSNSNTKGPYNSSMIQSLQGGIFQQPNENTFKNFKNFNNLNGQNTIK